MNKKEMISAVAKEVGITKTAAESAIDAVFNAISSSLSTGESVSVHNFGIFSIKERAERTARNPHTGEEIHVPATKAPCFKPSKALKEKVK